MSALSSCCHLFQASPSASRPHSWACSPCLCCPAVISSTTSNTGSMFGTAYYAIHNGLGSSEDTMMRSLSPEDNILRLKRLIFNIIETTLRQISDLHRNMGAILAAPLFFLALLHPFKRLSLGHISMATALDVDLRWNRHVHLRPEAGGNGPQPDPHPLRPTHGCLRTRHDIHFMGSARHRHNASTLCAMLTSSSSSPSVRAPCFSPFQKT